MVEIFHHRKEREHAGWRSSRYLRNDLSVDPTVPTRNLQTPRPSGEGHHQSPNRWSRRRSWVQYVSLTDNSSQPNTYRAPADEILLSHDKTIAVIDGSGVLADPVGINREELVRLAKARKPVAFFEKSKLSKDGYLVKIEDQDVKLPCKSGYALANLLSLPESAFPAGETVLDGTDFRNSAHLRFKADLFVPCGGRYVTPHTLSASIYRFRLCSPEAVNISNVAALIDSEGKPHFSYIVEGANLFFTQQARLYLEQRKVALFKDSSANKGGVTSSSLEVLAGLALTTEEYVDLMIFKNGKPSEFYQNYVRDIQEKISENAAYEFQCIWKEHARLSGSKHRTIISDELSSDLNNLQAELESSDLFDDIPSRKGVMRKAIPKTLVDAVGLDELLKRLPEPYQRAIFSSWVASRFVSLYGLPLLRTLSHLGIHWKQIYKYGVNGSSVDFFHFARDLPN